MERMRIVFNHTPFAVALTSLKVVCNGLPTSKLTSAALVARQWAATTPGFTCSAR